MIKKVLSIVLCLVTLFTCVPAMPVTADEAAQNTVRIEAENAYWNKYQKSSDSAFSGGGKLGNANGSYATWSDLAAGKINKKDGVYVAYTVDAPETGTYQVSVGAKVRMKAASSPYAAVLVNPLAGGENFAYQIPYGTQVGTDAVYLNSQKVDIQLQKGRNVIYMLPFTGNQNINWADADYLEISGDYAVTHIAPTQQSVAANAGFYYLFSTVSSDALAGSNFTAADAANLSAESITASDLSKLGHASYTVQAPADGYYDITLSFGSSGSHNTTDYGFALLVDDRAVEVKPITAVSGAADISTYLKKGEHTLTIPVMLPISDEKASSCGMYWTDLKGLTLHGGLTLAACQKSPLQNGNVVLEAERDAILWRYTTKTHDNCSAKVGGSQPDSSYHDSYAELSSGSVLRKSHQPMVTFPISVEKDGTYKVNISYHGYTGTEYYMVVSVDDESYYKTTYAGKDPNYTNRLLTAAELNLSAGQHFVRLLPLSKGVSAGWIDVDYMEIAGPGDVSAAGGWTHLLSDNAAYYQGFSNSGVTTHASEGAWWASALGGYKGNSMASNNGVTVENFKLEDIAYMGWFSYTIDVPADGYYDMQTYIHCGETGSGKMLLMVDKEYRWVDAAYGYSENKWNTVNLSCYLTKGTHVILVSGTMNYSGTKIDWCDMGALSVSGGITLSKNQLDPMEVCLEPAVAQWRLSLGDCIGVRFVFECVSSEDEISFFIGEDELPADRLTESKYMVYLAAAQMTDEIEIQVNGTPLEQTYSVRAYADTILSGGYSESTKGLVRQMLRYGSASQTYFDHNTNVLAAVGIPTVDRNFEADFSVSPETFSGEISALRFYGASLLFRSKTAVRFYFSGDVTGCVFTANGKSYPPEEKDGLWYVEIGEIAPNQLGEVIELVASCADQNITVCYSPMNYIQRMYEKNTSPASLKKLLVEMYYYYTTAKAYLDETRKVTIYEDAAGDVFYQNDIKTHTADPFVLDNTAIDGYYYLYGTWGYMDCYRSTNLMDWTHIGDAFDTTSAGSTDVISKDRWAPEVVYDSQEKLYYMFLSATPSADTVTTGKGVLTGNGKELLYVATSKYPDRGFRLVNFKNASSCGEENLHNFNKTAGISNGNGGYLDAYPHYYADYLLLDPAQYKAFTKNNGGFSGTYYGGYESAIDPHPYVAPNGDKYLFWTECQGADRICGVKMINWLKPDWSTATLLTCHGYYTVADWRGGGQVEKVSYEQTSPQINEGAVVTEHNGKYYLTYSANSYGDNSYLVAQAVADNVLGPYRKLTEAEGGILLSAKKQGGKELSGTGHHSFVTAGEQTLIVYHRHNDPAVGGSSRNHAIDEIKWITIKDKFGNDLEVMYANGPTSTVQAKVEAHSAYRNVAGEATVSGAEYTEYLTDGLLSYYQNANAEFVKYIPETVISETTTFAFDFAEAKTLRAIMVYNSRQADACFHNISRIELDCLVDGELVTRYIDSIAFSAEHYQANIYDGQYYYVTPCTAAYAVFDELAVVSVRITLEVPKGQKTVNISEIKILGK